MCAGFAVCFSRPSSFGLLVGVPLLHVKMIEKDNDTSRGVAPLPMSVAFRNAKSELLIYSVLHVVT